MHPVMTDSVKRSPGSVFGMGVLVGFLMAAVVVIAAGRAVSRQGISVRVETAPIAAQVEDEVRAAVRREVPATLSAMKEDLPQRIGAETAQRLSQTTIGVAGFNVPVPEAAARQVQAGVESAVRAGLNLAVTDQDINALSDRLAHHAAGLVQTNLNQYLTGRTFPVDLWPGFSVPVTIIPQ